MFVNSKSLDFIGGAERDRTVDLLNKTQMFYLACTTALCAFDSLNFIQKFHLLAGQRCPSLQALQRTLRPMAFVKSWKC